MLLKFFYALRDAKIPVSLKEYLMLLEGLEKEVIPTRLEDFYYFARTSLIKDERNLDKFDLIFGKTFKGLEGINGEISAEIPDEWLNALAQKYLTEEEKKQIEALGGFDKLMETLKQRLEEQKEKHQGGNKWIGTGGTSPFGHSGYNPEGIRIGGQSTHRRAVKVWEKREFKDLNDDVEIGTRNIKVALKRLRKWARMGAADELDLAGTINKTAKDGYLDVVLRPERRNNVKVLALFDIGGSMDDHIKVCEELFSASKSEFKHFEHYYFHNCLYETLWHKNNRRNTERIDTYDVLHKYSGDYKVVVVGDAAMSPYEIAMKGGSVEHWNEEAGAVWLERLVNQFPHLIWINPVRPDYWHYSASTDMIRQIIGPHRMFPMTLEGLDNAMKELNK
ncbi:vWA domain-containing protein [Pseudaquidulcibacter saccharophilus]|uniref:vWA domain-containing protein n=1 Tax=Pseudaquidulcibacter saccharophilus TaxID=2831900 RepID=UPI001EFEF493|nr:VWA domain-containing protein [Pseudaquidulcibacter saccharophilus]